MDVVQKVRVIAQSLRRMPRDAMVDPLEAVRWNAAHARALDALAAEMTPEEARAVNPRTSRPGERRRMVVAQRRLVLVESRSTL